MARSTPRTGAKWLSSQTASSSSPEDTRSARLSGALPQGKLPRPILPGFGDAQHYYRALDADTTSLEHPQGSQ